MLKKLGESTDPARNGRTFAMVLFIHIATVYRPSMCDLLFSQFCVLFSEIDSLLASHPIERKTLGCGFAILTAANISSLACVGAARGQGFCTSLSHRILVHTECVFCIDTPVGAQSKGGVFGGLVLVAPSVREIHGIQLLRIHGCLYPYTNT